MRYRFSERWSTKADLRWIHRIDDAEDDGLFTIALSYAFGKKTIRDSDKDGVNDSADQCPNTLPAVTVEATGCEKDTDQDGVPDSTDQCPATRRGVSVDSLGCERDSDSDGVVDSQDQCPASVAGVDVDSRGCAEKLTRTETITLNITFAIGSAELTQHFMDEINKVASFMRRFTSVEGVIEGHTDSSGRAAFNKNLSQQRADAVRNILVSQFGIEAQRLNAIGYGEERPIASDDTVQGRQKNRRVVAVFNAQVTQ